MSKNNIVFLIGLILFLMPILFGFPTRWEHFFDVVFGLALVVLSFSVTIKRRASYRARRNRKNPTAIPSFVDGMGSQSLTPNTTTFEEKPVSSQESSTENFSE